MSIRDYLIKRQVNKMKKKSDEEIEGLDNFLKYLLGEGKEGEEEEKE